MARLLSARKRPACDDDESLGGRRDDSIVADVPITDEEIQTTALLRRPPWFYSGFVELAGPFGTGVNDRVLE